MSAQTPDSTTYEREDLPAIARSVEQQWTALRHLLHLPSIAELQNNPNQLQVAKTIANEIKNVRGSLANREQLERVLFQNFNEHSQTNDRAPAIGNAQSRGVVLAEAWLKAIYNHLGEQDIQKIFESIPASICTTNANNKIWSSNNVMIGGVRYVVRVDLTDPHWRTGNKDEIRARLLNNTSDEVGLIIVPRLTRKLTDADVDAILDSKTNIVDPKLAIYEVRMDDFPNPGQYTLVNLPRLIERGPNSVSDRVGDMISRLVANTPLFEECVRSFDENDNPITRPAVAPMAHRLFRKLSRNPGMSLAARESTLSAALDLRSSAESLLKSSADNRELMLALTTVQRDPTALEVLNAEKTNTDKLRNDMNVNENLLNAAQSLKALKDVGSLKLSEAQIIAGKSAMSTVIQNASHGIALQTGESINIFSGQKTDTSGTPSPLGTALSADEIKEANRMRITSSLVRISEPAVKKTPGRDNSDTFKKVIQDAQQAIDKYEEAETKLNKVFETLEMMSSLFKDQEIQPAQITNPPYAQLYKCFNIAGGTFSPLKTLPNPLPPPPPTPQPYIIDKDINLSQLDQEFRRALTQANPSKSLSLQSVDVYEKKREELSTKYTEVSNNPKSSLSGSEGCWAIVRRGLENQGMRGEDLDNTLRYMRNQVQHTPQLAKDIKTLASAAFPYVGDGHDDELDKHIAKHWNHDKQLGYLPGNAWKQYWDRLKKEQKRQYQMDFNDNPRANKNFSLNSTLNIYFQMKHLQSLPESDPHHLPQSLYINNRMRLFHAALLERGQESFNKAANMDTAELDQLRNAGMNVDPKHIQSLTALERVQAVQSFLVDNSYIEANKEVMNRLAENAWKRLGRKVDLHKKSVARWGNVGSTTAGVVKKPLTAAWNGIKGVGQIYNENRGAIVAGGLAGLIAMPGYGAIIGAAATPIVYHYLQKLSAGASGQPAAAHH